MMAELRVFFPLKEVSFYNDFTGQSFTTQKDENFNWDKINQNLDELYSYTTQLSFGHKLDYSGSYTSALSLNHVTGNSISPRANKWNTYVFERILEFSFQDEISIEDKKTFIKHHFFDAMWEAHTISVEDPQPSFRKMLKKQLYQHSPPSNKVADRAYLKDHAFLLKKLFSDNFEAQFKNYMYSTYPWRYANNFLNKESAKQNAMAIAAFMAFIIIILSISLFWNKKHKLSFTNYFLPILIYLISFNSLKIVYSYFVHIEHSYTHNIPTLIAPIFIIVIVALVLSFLFWQTEKRLIANQMDFGFQLVLKLLITFLFLYIPNLVVTSYNDIGIISYRYSYTRILSDFQFLFIAIGLTLGRGLLIYLNHFSDSLVKQKDVELSRLKEMNAQSELKLLQSHINPHFLYNALNSIAGLAHTNADKTEKMALSLSDLFRYSINKKGQKMSTVSEEVTMVKNYIDIENIRFGKRLTFNISIDDALNNEKIPMYILQPLVENAIKHGISKIGGHAKIGLEIKKENNKLIISISDNGPDFPKSLISGHGLQTVHDLLRLSYGNKASIQWENIPKKQIVISITQTSQNNE